MRAHSLKHSCGAKLVVATPGRLEDFLKRKLVRLEGVKILCSTKWTACSIWAFSRHCAYCGHAAESRQTLCYSATLEGAVKEVARKYLNNPARIEIGSVLKPAENVELRTFEVEADKKQELLEHLLSAEEGSFLVFVRTKHGAIAWRGDWFAPATRRRRFTGRTQSQRNRRSLPARDDGFAEAAQCCALRLGAVPVNLRREWPERTSRRATRSRRAWCARIQEASLLGAEQMLEQFLLLVRFHFKSAQFDVLRRLQNRTDLDAPLDC